MFPLLEVFNIGSKILDRVLPDPKAKAEAQLELMKLAQAGELANLDADLKLALGQIEVNKVEAASPNLFVSGWRPGVGWTCVAGLAYSVLGQPFSAWVSLIRHIPVPPTDDTSTLITLLIGMLGLGGMRTVEKIQGVTK